MWHVADAGQATWAGLAEEAFRLAGLDVPVLYLVGEQSPASSRAFSSSLIVFSSSSGSAWIDQSQLFVVSSICRQVL